MFDDDVPLAVKFGMLTSAKTIAALASSTRLTQRPDSTLAVLDPVMISTSGHTLLPDDAIEALKGLFMSVDWLTPNIPEALRLSGQDQKKDVGGLEGLLELAKITAEKCEVPVVLLKGGHFPISRAELKGLTGKYRVIFEEGDDEEDTVDCLKLWRRQTLGQDAEEGKVVVDILLQRNPSSGSSDNAPTLFVGKHVQSDSTHGTGCTLSSAIAASYAIANTCATVGEIDEHDAERNIEIAKRAIEYTRSAIATAYKMGEGHGPLNHSHLTTRRALPQPTQTNPHPFVSHLIQSNLPLWKSYVRPRDRVCSPRMHCQQRCAQMTDTIGPASVCCATRERQLASGCFRALH